MLLPALAVLIVCALGAVVIALIMRRICERVGLDPMEALLWFGLAERPVEVPRKHRRRLGELLADGPAPAGLPAD